MKLFFKAMLLSSLIFTTPVISTPQDSVEQTFTNYYNSGKWGVDENGKGISGSGSIVENAAPYMSFLENFVKANEIKTIIDIGCGDWLFSRHINWNNANYLGIDVVKRVIEKNNQQFANSKVSFIHGDSNSFVLPNSDLLICKDDLQHLPHAEVFKFLKQIHKFKHCLITNDVDAHSLSSNNYDIAPGDDYRTIDLSKAPFNVKGTKVFTYKSGYVTKQVFYICN